MDAELKRLYEAGMSMACIAAEIGMGLTRNAVIGRVHRLKLPSRGKPVKTAHKPREPRQVTSRPRLVRANGNSDKMRVQAVRSSDMPALRCVEVVPLHLAFPDLPGNGCRYPYGDDVYTFCGHPQRPGSSYCGHHWALSISTESKRSRSEGEIFRRENRAKHRQDILEAAE